MIKLNLREMKNLSRILSIVLCFAPFAYANAAGTVATTAGSNLTAFNPSNANNNQWAMMSNGRYDTNTTAKANFGNCNALILRCAQPKCTNGGCAEAGIAAAIVKGCVQSNKTCSQYGDDLIEYMSAQLVASSNAKINEQNLAAAAAAQQQSEQQMAAMQQQMQQMQALMVDQQEQSQQQLQAALAEQAAQNQAALEEMKNAATEAAKETEAGISAYQQEAIDRGISEDVLTRQTITGQIMTEIENAETSLKEVKVAMNNAFEYAKCDARGNSCSGPKRVKKWRELSREFSDPYNNTIDKIYDALMIAQTVGVDMSQIYMMLNNSCNQWGQYLCPQMKGGTVYYPSTAEGQKGTPQVCKDSSGVDQVCLDDCDKKYPLFKTTPLTYGSGASNNGSSGLLSSVGQLSQPKVDGLPTNVYDTSNLTANTNCKSACRMERNNCQPCTLIKVLTESDDDRNAVYEGWVNAEYSTDNGNTTVVACASSALDSAKLFARRTRTKNGANLVDMDMLELWLDQIGPDKKSGNIGPEKYCSIDVSSMKDTLRKSTLSKSVDVNKMYCDMNPNGDCRTVGAGSVFASYINPIYAICDAHQYNAGIANNQGLNSDKISEIKEIVGLKTTVVSQQMYKQYEYLNATLRRLKTQLEKAALTTTLQAAGAKSEDGSSSSSSGGLLGGNSSNDDKTIHLAGAENCANKMSSDAVYSCLQSNISLIISSAKSNTRNACKQLKEAITVADTWEIYKKDTKKIGEYNGKECSDIKDNVSKCDKNNVAACAQMLNVQVIRKKEEKSNQQQNRNNVVYPQ